MSQSKFWTKWYGRGVIHSSEGYSIHPGRDRLVYREGKRSMSITVDMGPNAFDVFIESIGRWDDDLEHTVDETTKTEIIERIRKALESQRQSVRFL